jgi:hypothetical protein
MTNIQGLSAFSVKQRSSMQTGGDLSRLAFDNVCCCSLRTLRMNLRQNKKWIHRGAIRSYNRAISGLRANLIPVFSIIPITFHSDGGGVKVI